MDARLSCCHVHVSLLLDNTHELQNWKRINVKLKGACGARISSGFTGYISDRSALGIGNFPPSYGEGRGIRVPGRGPY